MPQTIVLAVTWSIVAVMAINLTFVCSVVLRRLTRAHYFRQKDRYRQRFRPIVQNLIHYRVSTAEAAEVLRRYPSRAAKDALRELLMAEMAPGNADRITALFFALGTVAQWARAAFGGRANQIVVSALSMGCIPLPERKRRPALDTLRRTRALSVPRLLSVDALGRLAPKVAEIFALAAMDDPAGTVRRVALGALGRHQSVAGIPYILRELRSALVHERNAHRGAVSARSAKAALVSYGLEHLTHFVQYLLGPDPTVRFYLVDSIREITARESTRRSIGRDDFPAELRDVFLLRLVHDPSADVRARSAAVVPHFHTEPAYQAMLRLLEDENEFVRLHSVRAVAAAGCWALLPALAARTTDTRWRVREAAVRVLARSGERAQELLLKEFVRSTDRYESEQITEELQRSGLAQRVLGRLTGDTAEAALPLAVCKRMIEIGRTSMLRDELFHGTNDALRLILMDVFASHPSRESLNVLKNIAATERPRIALRAAKLLTAAENQPMPAGVS